MKGFLALLQRDLLLQVREGSALGTALGFYLVVVTLMPLGVGPDLSLLSRLAPGLLWIAMLLSALLSLPRIFETDQEDGSLEILVTAEPPLELAVAAKSLAHWLTTGIPLAVLAPLLGFLLNLDFASAPLLFATMLCGSSSISFLGAVGAALTLRAKRGGLLLAFLMIPFYVPTLIFGISALAEVSNDNTLLRASFLLLSALSLFSCVIGPLAAAAALRIQNE